MEENSDQSRCRSSYPNDKSSCKNPVNKGAGRKRGRGKGRGRGRGRCARGGNNGVRRNRLAIDAREQRNAQIQERINNMNEEELRSTMLNTCRRRPSFAFNLLEQENERNPDPAPQSGQPHWCTCTYCREIPEGEKMCCKENSERCHSRMPDFYTIVLDELVLEVAARHRDDVLAQPPYQDYNRGRRHTAYRQYILWRHGYLGAGYRRVAQNCCV